MVEATMTFNARTARRLCTDSELALYEQSRQFELQSLTERQLKRHVTRARRKFEQLAARSHKTPDVAAKTELMHEILARFERQLVHMMMSLREKNRPREENAFFGDGADYGHMGRPPLDTRLRPHADETAQGALRRFEEMLAARDRRSRMRDAKH
jgi:hypothetical protein